MQLHFDWPVWLGIVTTIMQGIASGTIHLTNMIPERYIPTATAYAGFFATINSLVLTAVLGLHVPDLPKLAAYVGSMIVSPAYGQCGQGGCPFGIPGADRTPGFARLADPKCGWLRGGVWSCANPTTANGEPAITAADYMFILTCEQQNDRSFCDRERTRILHEGH